MTAITRKLLDGLLAISASAHNAERSHEFSCFLLAEEGIIMEFWLGPGTVESERYALLKLHNLPFDSRRVGTAHSHPSRNAGPSDDDLHLFSQAGDVHIIMGYPYTMESWKAYDRQGREIHLEVV